MPNIPSSHPVAKSNQSGENNNVNKSIWPIMIFKIIAGKIRTKKGLLIAFITLLSLGYIVYHMPLRDNIQASKQQDLNQQLDKYQRLYQEQLSINQTLKTTLESTNKLTYQDIHKRDETDSDTGEQDFMESESFDGLDTPDETTASGSRFEQALKTFEDNESIRFPLPPALKASLFQMIPNDTPVNYKRVSSPYGNRLHPISGKWKRHLGMDLTCPLGTPVFATADGVIEMTRASNQGYGNLLKIRHSFGFSTLYAHLNQFSVKPGQFVEKGDRVGFCGSSGNSTGSHLHYEVRFIGKTLNPKDFMTWKPEETAQLFSQQKQVPWNSLIEQLNRTVNLQVLLAMSSKMNHKNSIDTKPVKQAKKRSEGLQDFGLNEDGWTTVAE
ncbi:M23 family metallopeptidase [Vibrio rumoiensis]|uniref:M23ase beta-sheet core domain-containing protein n=1 Tax=Vibrio rumoiensis 1S-45 TaxID=1188252 RepID=A0A1E5DYX8_9VIBR|nr:M23 family metallopeptidase [Vibrio rumoiensis]OEF22569.1 hypothetical protein A1QC_13605 [Vibrio rumoiensis 1S-45]